MMRYFSYAKITTYSTRMICYKICAFDYEISVFLCLPSDDVQHELQL